MEIHQTNNYLYTKDHVIDFVSFNISPTHIETIKKAINQANNLLKKGLLKHTITVDKRLILISQIKRKRLLKEIKIIKKLPIQTDIVYMLTLI